MQGLTSKEQNPHQRRGNKINVHEVEEDDHARRSTKRKAPSEKTQRSEPIQVAKMLKRGYIRWQG